MSKSKFNITPENFIEYDKITDELIINLFKTNRYMVNGTLLSYYINKHEGRYDHNVLRYIENRYSDSESLKETLYRINYGVETRPTCKICGGHLTPVFDGNCGYVFKDHCGAKCAANDPEVKSKLNLPEYTDKANISRKQHWLELTNGEYSNPSQIPEVKLKKEKTTLKHFGVKNPFQSKEIISKFDKEKIIKHSITTKKNNNSFKQSRDEVKIYNMLVKLFGTDNVIRQYVDKRYMFTDKHPYLCDFYIPELDLFIEYNGTWTHGGAPFDKTNEEHICRLKIWEEKAKTSNYYKNAIHTWTIKDVVKRQVCINNNLNFVELWNLDEAIKFVNSFETQIRNNLS